MTFWRMPLLVWMELTAAVVFLLSVGPLVAGAVMLLLDRMVGTELLRARRRRRPAAVAASVLVLRPSRSLRHRTAGLRNHDGNHAGVLAQADLRLPHDSHFSNRCRSAELRRVGASHVRQRDGSASRDPVQHHDDPHLGAVRDHGVRDDRDVVARLDQSHDPDAVRARRTGDFHHRRRDRNLPRLRRHPISTCTAPTSSSRTSTTRFSRRSSSAASPGSTTGSRKCSAE